MCCKTHIYIKQRKNILLLDLLLLIAKKYNSCRYLLEQVRSVQYKDALAQCVKASLIKQSLYHPNTIKSSLETFSAASFPAAIETIPTANFKESATPLPVITLSCISIGNPV